MNAKLEHVVSTGQLEDGAFIAFSNTSPYFCFEATTEQAALEVAGRALNYYYGVQGSIKAPEPKRIQRNLTGVTRRRNHRIEIAAVA